MKFSKFPKVYIQLMFLPIVFAYNNQLNWAEVNGLVDGLPNNTKIYLVRDGGKDTVATSLTKDGRFSFRINLKYEGEFYFLRLDSAINTNPSKPVLISSGKTKVRSLLSEWPIVLVDGSAAHNEYLIIRDTIQKINEEFRRVENQLTTLQNTFDEAKLKSGDTIQVKNELKMIQRQFMQLKNQRDSLIPDIIYRYPNSFYTPFLLLNNPLVFNYELLKYHYNRLTSISQNSYYGVEIKRILDAGSLSVGGIVNDIEGLTPDGHKTSLKKIIGKSKYTLIDFWASWCKPCREENPKLKEAFEKYRFSGFNIVSISSDYNLNKWKAAINEDKMEWDHMIDYELSGSIARTFLINSLPAWFLVDKNGTVVETDYSYFNSNGQLRNGNLILKLDSLIKDE